MKAVVHTRYGTPAVLRLLDVEQPRPNDHEVLIRVRATTVTRSDCGYRAAKPFITRFFTGLVRPRAQILGSEFAGEIVAAGNGVSGFAVGDEVFGVNAVRFGAHAEYVCMGQGDPLAHKPTVMTFEQAVLRAEILIYGASGSIGTAGVQLAKYFGAHVTAVCSSTAVETVKSLGADEVIDYTQHDFTTDRATYDVVFDAVGKLSYRRCRSCVKPGGMYVVTDLGFLWQNPVLALLTSWIGNKRLFLPVPRYTQRDVGHRPLRTCRSVLSPNGTLRLV